MPKDSGAEMTPSRACILWLISTVQIFCTKGRLLSREVCAGIKDQIWRRINVRPGCIHLYPNIYLYTCIYTHIYLYTYISYTNTSRPKETMNWITHPEKRRMMIRWYFLYGGGGGRRIFCNHRLLEASSSMPDKSSVSFGMKWSGLCGGGGQGHLG